MNRLDPRLSEIQRWVRLQPLLYRLTLGTRVLLAVGFIPTGMVKLLGQRFTSLSLENDVGAFFETLYQSGLYWHFLGLVQVFAGVLVLWPVTATLGAVLFFGIMLNIFVITLSYDFNYTPVVTASMLAATLYLLLWDYHRLRALLGLSTQASRGDEAFPRHRLGGVIERGAYVGGVVAGLGFFSGTRGLFFSGAWTLWFLLGCLISFAVAIWCGAQGPP